MISKDFFEALKDLEAEKGIPEGTFIPMLEKGLTAAYKRQSGKCRS